MKRSQDHVSASLSWTAARAAILLIVSVLFLTSKAMSQIEDEGVTFALGLRSNVVRIETQTRNHMEEGFGFVAGANAGSLYIVTAYHVVSDSQGKKQESPIQVKVEFFGLRDGIHVGGGELYEAKRMEAYDESHDLAVLTVPAPPGFRWNSRCRCMGRPQEQQRRAELYFIGKSKKPESSNWYVAPTPGHVTSKAPRDSEIDIDGLWAAPGSSGGPVIGATGIAGMILSSTPDHTKALSIDFIKAAFLEWGYPWTLDYAKDIPQDMNPPACTKY